jgi:hypothetical protein
MNPTPTEVKPPRRENWVSRVGWDVIVVAGIGCLMTLPLWLAHRPPLQDLPQHAAAVQILSRFGDARWHFSEYFTINLGRTQYLTVYLAALPFARLFGALTAMKLIVAITWVATPLSVLALLRAIGKDGWLALLVLPLTYNAHALTGFVNFIAAIPLMFFGMAYAIRLYQKPSRRRSWLLAGLLILTFYTHIVPYGVLLLAVIALAFDRNIRVLLGRLIPVVPSVIAGLIWFFTSPAGLTLARITKPVSGSLPPRYVQLPEAIRAFADWLTPGLPGDADPTRFAIWSLLCAMLWALSASRSPSSTDQPDFQKGRSASMRLAFLLPLCIACYFWLPVSYDFIWPISLRFPLIAAYLLPLWLVHAPAWGRRAAGVLSTALAASALMDVGGAFQQFERTELRGLDEVIAKIPQGSRVAGLIFNPQSSITRQSSLLQSVAWVQVEKGGAVMFTFADFPQSPFSFRASNRPPPVPPRWEWEPGRVDPERDLKWYEFVLVHAGPGAIAVSSNFSRVVQSGTWSLWRQSSFGRN